MSTADDVLVPDGRSRARVFARGAAAGATAWLLGYLIVYVTEAKQLSRGLRGVGFVFRLLGGEAVPAWKDVTWLFLNAHFAATRVPSLTGATRTVNFVTGDTAPVALLALPPALLLVAGALAAYDESPDLLLRATAGATVVIGYLPFSVAAVVLASHAAGDTGVTIAPDPVTTVLLAGAVYPLVFGALGGIAVGVLTGSRSPSQRPPV